MTNLRPLPSVANIFEDVDVYAVHKVLTVMFNTKKFEKAILKFCLILKKVSDLKSAPNSNPF